MKTVEVLRKAKELIATPERWTQGYWARNASNNSTSVTHDDACRFCAHGAVRRVIWEEFGCFYDDPADHALRLLDSVVPSGDASDWNDKPGRRHKAVLAAFDRAIALAERES